MLRENRHPEQSFPEEGSPVRESALSEQQPDQTGNSEQPGTAPAPRLVLDTDCLVAAAYAPGSASQHVLEACLQGRVVALVSPDLRQEYEYILSRAVRGRDFGPTFRQFLAGADLVCPAETPRVVPDDPADDKLVAAALAGRADALVTNDRHLLRLDPHGDLRILRPAEFVRLWLSG
jgi:putative PIN family toxin of toxin-antitoxin system